MRLKLKAKPKVLFWLIFAIFMVTLCADGDNGRVIDLSVICLFGVSIFLNLSTSKKKLLQLVNTWYMLFVSMAFLSVAWSIERADSLAMCRLLLKQALVIFSLSMCINNMEDIYTALKIFLLACLVMMLKISFYVVFQGYSGTKMWDLICGNYFNTVAQILAISIAIAFYFFQRATKKFDKLIYIGYIAFAMYHIFLTKSRKGFMMPFVEIGIIIILQSGLNVKKILKYFVISLCGVGILAYFLAQNDAFTERLYMMFAMVFSGVTLDESAMLRKSFIKLAARMFASNPILGCGINTFPSQCNIQFGRYYYAHNNFMELLSGVGLLGTFIYYSLYVRSIVELYKLRTQNGIYTIGLSVYATLMVFEYGIVTYSVFLYPILLTIFAVSYKEDILKEGEKECTLDSIRKKHRSY